MRTLTESDVAPLCDGEYVIAGSVPHKWQHEPGFRYYVVAFANAILAKFGGGISEGEARERERGAYAMGAEENPQPGFIEECARARYPVPLSFSEKPRTVTLSDGRVFVYVPRHNGNPDRPGWRDESGSMFYPCPPCATASDFAACAALLREEGR